MHLDVRDVMSIYTGLLKDLPVEVLLSAGMRMGDGNSLCGVIRRSAKNAGQDVIIVRNGVLVPLEDDRATTVATAVAISVVVVRLAAAGLGQELTL